MRHDVFNSYTHSRNARRGGFSFTEILFAVMILGIGFIMVAAIFPVAIRQTQETVEETSGAAVAKGGASYLARFGTNANFPVTGGKVVNGSSAPFWQAVNGNLILSTDRRYGWVPYYSRPVINGAPAPYAQVTIIAVECQNGSNFTNADLNASSGVANLQGRPLTANFTQGAGVAADTVSFTGTDALSVAPGAYIVVADDGAPTGTSCDGFVYRIGNNTNPSNPGNTWELIPGSDTKNSRFVPRSGVQVFVVGNGALHSGSAMDIAAYSTFIQIH